MNHIELIRERHSVRNYLDKPIETEKVERLKKKLRSAMRPAAFICNFARMLGRHSTRF